MSGKATEGRGESRRGTAERHGARVVCSACSPHAGGGARRGDAGARRRWDAQARFAWRRERPCCMLRPEAQDGASGLLVAGEQHGLTVVPVRAHEGKQSGLGRLRAAGRTRSGWPASRSTGRESSEGAREREGMAGGEEPRRPGAAVVRAAPPLDNVAPRRLALEEAWSVAPVICHACRYRRRAAGGTIVVSSVGLRRVAMAEVPRASPWSNRAPLSLVPPDGR